MIGICLANHKITQIFTRKQLYESGFNTLDLLRNNLEKSGERISVKGSNMRGAVDALEGSIS